MYGYYLFLTIHPIMKCYSRICSEVTHSQCLPLFGETLKSAIWEVTVDLSITAMHYWCVDYSPALIVGLHCPLICSPLNCIPETILKRLIVCLATIMHLATRYLNVVCIVAYFDTRFKFDIRFGYLFIYSFLNCKFLNYGNIAPLTTDIMYIMVQNVFEYSSPSCQPP
jgi:hypothetical protein